MYIILTFIMVITIYLFKYFMLYFVFNELNVIFNDFRAKTNN